LSVNKEIEKSHLPIVFVEGDYDVKYLTKTIELFYSEQNLFEKFRLVDGARFGNLDKIWKSMDSKAVELLIAKTLLLYDCDTSKSDAKREKIVRRTMPMISSNPIGKGIENLLPPFTIGKLEKENPQFIDSICNNNTFANVFIGHAADLWHGWLRYY
jgi:hypothetical protein